jgi:hypothetical protein
VAVVYEANSALRCIENSCFAECRLK